MLNKKPLHNVKNIVFRSNDEVVETDIESLVTEDELKNYTVYDYENEYLDNVFFPIEGGRGCPYKCTFCTTSSFWSNSYRKKPVNVIIDEMIELQNKYNVDNFDIVHDNFTVDRSYVTEFCNKIIDNKLEFSWGCSSRIDSLDYDMIKLMKEANCTKIFFGIESASKRVQALINKNLNIKKIFETVEYIKEFEIDMALSFIYCLPEEKLEDFAETFNMIEAFMKRGIFGIQILKYIPVPRTVEANKVRDIQYFDKNELDINIVGITKFNDKAHTMIKENPDIFSYCYTFETEVKEKYYYFDTFVFAIGESSIYFKNCCKYIINSYGLEWLYRRCEDKLAQIHDILQSYRITYERLEFRHIVLSLIEDCMCEVFDYVSEYKDLKFTELYKYEYNKFLISKYRQSEYKIVNFNIDIGAYLRNGEVKEQNMNIKMYYQDDKVYTKIVK